MNVTEKSYILEQLAKPELTAKESPADNKDEENSNKTSVTALMSVTFNYLNSIIGSGIIGMPYALRMAGPALGTLLLILVAFITDYSLVILVKAGELAGSNSYQGVMEKVFGRPGYLAISLIQFIYPFIAMVSYNVVVGDTITQVVARILQINANTSSVFVRREFVSLITSIFITLPLGLYKDVEKLGKSSLLSMALVAFVMVTVFVRMMDIDGGVSSVTDLQDLGSQRLFDFSGSLRAISVMTFAFMCHHNTFLLYCSIPEPSLITWRRVTHVSISLSFVLLMAMAVGGFATFTNLVQGDILNNYCWNDDLMNVSRIVFSVTVLLTYPLELFVSRDVFLTLVDKKDHSIWHYLTTFAIIIVTWGLSCITDCLGVVLEINGLLAAVPLAFVLPALCYLKLEDGPWLKKAPAGLLTLFGITVTTLGTINIITQGPPGCSDAQDMPYCHPINDTNV